MSIENIILSHLVYNKEYARKVIPFVKVEYFSDSSYKVVCTLIEDYANKYNESPSKEALYIDLENKNDMNEDTYQKTKEVIASLACEEVTNQDWLLNETERHFQERAVYNALMESIAIHSDTDATKDKGSIPQILSEALSVSFDSNIGHDFIDNADSRFEFYHSKESRIAFDLEIFNRVTQGGVSRKTLTIALASTGVGKTMFMTHCAAANIMQGYNVLYITMEMSEERIAERIDANLMNVTNDDLRSMSRELYDKKMAKVSEKVKGKLIIKEYPTSGASVAHFRHLIQELKLKKGFTPDIIYIDYLNICSSFRVKMGNSVNSYTYIKSIAEELRGLAVETNTAVFTATQTNRDGYGSSDVDLANTSESFGVPATADLMFALISTEELEEMAQLMVKILKNRYGENGKKFVIGMDRAKMQLYDAEESAQSDIQSSSKKKKKQDGPVMDTSKFGERFNDDTPQTWKKTKRNFDDFMG
jgi:replicative DNA helicase